jgi:predicted ABC-class ATPase
MVNSNSDPLVELEAEIVQMEEEIPDRPTRDRVLAIPKKLFTEAQNYQRKGNDRETSLIINCACRLLERAKHGLRK